MSNKHALVLDLQHIDKTAISLVGGKAANLGELCRIEGIVVPDGFCVSTEAFKKIVEETPAVNRLLEQLALLKPEDTNNIRTRSRELRTAIEAAAIPENIVTEITAHIAKFGEENTFAVRSSATAEDLPTASFAGQQDTYLNISGKEAILKHISKCWASLFTERAIVYRLQSGYDHRKVHLAVIVQKMVFPEASGIVFTADPVNGNRKVLSVDAGFGLGEALVAGLVNADNYNVVNSEVTAKKISVKKLAIYASPGGGTKEQALAPELQQKQVLTDEQVLQLEHIGRKIETYFGYPQDIEWCLADDRFYIVQSRPITTLFPLPVVNDKENHVYVSVGHQQMMTDAFKPLGLSLWQLTAARPMYTAGGRLFVDVAPDLASPAKRWIITDVLGKSDPLTKSALTTVLERRDFITLLPEEKQEQNATKQAPGHTSVDFQTLKDYDPAIVTELIARSEADIAALKQNIRLKSGTELIDFILDDMPQSRQRLSGPKSFGVIVTAMNAASWINDNMQEWLGEKNAADTVTQSVPNNVTSEMGLALLDVADVIRPYPEVIAYLQQPGNDFLNGLLQFNGGKESSNAISTFLDKYGMRCAGEIDITRTRWSENPAAIVPMLLNNINSFAPGESSRKFEQGLREATQKEQELLARLKELPDGERKAAETKRMIGLVRSLAGYREYPKYSIVSRYFVYKQALMNEAEQLVQDKVIRKKEDIYYLNFEELREMIRTKKVDYSIIDKRKEQFKAFEKLTPPRVMTSDGEIITGSYGHENLPAGAIAGLAVSSGMVEGRARVVLNMEDANLENGDILITKFTDPGWTPLFVSVKGLVTEVGGLMTHGAVIAREYGLPAVVGVEGATTLIKDGQRIRVHGTEGYVELL